MLVVLLVLVLPSLTAAELCDVIGGKPVIVLDLPESIGNEINQQTSPAELPLEGDVTAQEISIALSDDGLKHFKLSGKSLELLHPIDREGGNFFTIRFTLQCTELSTSKQRSVPVVVRVVDRNDNPPVFVGGPYSVTVEESTPVGTTIFSTIKATDADAGTNGQVRYSLVPGDGGTTDGYGYFSIPLTHQGVVTLAKPLDFELSKVLVLNIRASDIAPTDPQSSISTLTVTMVDSDDQDPVYTPCDDCTSPPTFTARVTAGVRSGVVDVAPHRIQAKDQDSLSAPIRYSFSSGSPASFRQFFSIDSVSGAVSQIAAVPRGLASQFKLTVKAEEVTPRKGAAFATLMIEVELPDSAMPVIRSSAVIGSVAENAPPGTPVLDEKGDAVKMVVNDPDLLPSEVPPEYQFELTTGAFKVSDEGELQVALPSLDRDPPSLSVHTFQVVAREMSGSQKAASAPITLTVKLTDTNDNAPRFPVYSALTVAAGDHHLTIKQVSASDPDEGVNSALTYALTGVVGGSPSVRFFIDEETGAVRLVGTVTQGEKYTLTIEATDGGGLSGSTTLEVIVDRGPNTGGPYFPRRQFSTIVEENALPGTTVIKLKAIDPDGDIPRYSLHPLNKTSPSGEVIEAVGESLPFQVDPLSGEVTLSSTLDRETLDKYSMVIRAEDNDGLSGSVTLDVTVADVNDQAPSFVDAPYSFRVDEGKQGVLLGVVKATDQDEDRSGLVEYSIESPGPLSIGPYNGTVFTSRALDFEKQQVHYLIVTATDGGRPPLSSTTTLTLLVGDVSDEPPKFEKEKVEVSIKESAPVGSLITTVHAKDPDSNPSVTYYLQSAGPERSLFTVHAETGRVSTTNGLDREKAAQYVLVIGTKENSGNGRGSTTSVFVSIIDENDSPPVVRHMPPLVVTLDIPVNTVLTTARATDDDATSPNNKLEYSLVSPPETEGHIAINSTTGEIKLLKTFLGRNITEFEVEVTATDGGDPPLSSSTSLRLLVEVEGIPPPRFVQPPTFSRNQVFLDIKEDTPVGGMVARVGIINPPRRPICTLVGGESFFKARLTDSSHCGVEVSAPLEADGADGVTEVELTLELREKKEDGEEEALNVTATVTISISDVNDNSPMFEFSTTPPGEEESQPPSYPHRMGGSVLVLNSSMLLLGVSQDAEQGTVVATLNATDADSGMNGELEYTLLTENNRGGYFSIDRQTGAVRTNRQLVDLTSTLNPIHLSVRVTDSPMNGRKLSATADILVHVITPAHRMVLPVGGVSVEELVEKEEQIVEALFKSSDGLIILEDIVQSPRTDTGSELRLAMVDSKSWELLSKSHPAVNRVMSGASDEPTSLRYHLLKAIGVKTLKEEIKSVEKKEYIPPLSIQDSIFGGTNLSDGGPESLLASVPGLQLGLVVLAIAILILGLISILYICVQWARAVKHRGDQSPMMPIMRVPILAHPAPSSITDTLHKQQQYEVQMLSMSVPVDDESVKDVPSYHNNFMDNVSYISKNHNMAENSSNSGSGNHFDESWNHHLPSTSRGYGSQLHPDSDSDNGGDYSRSQTNQNVMFGRSGQNYSNRGFEDNDSTIGYGFEGAGMGDPVAPILDLSPVQTTTLL